MAGTGAMDFLEDYVAAAARGLAALAGRGLTGAELAALRAEAAGRFADRPAAVANTSRNLRVQTSLAEVAGWAPRRDRAAPEGGGARLGAPAVWTGPGTMFKPQDESDSVMGKMLQTLLDRREVAKRAMFELIRSGLGKDDYRVRAKDQEQKIWKLLANSWFGAQGERGFHFFHPDMGPAITYTGRVSIAATIWGFEAFLSGNFWVSGPDELARHAASCAGHCAGLPWPDAEWGLGPAGTDPGAEAAAAALRRVCAPGWDSGPAADAIAARLPPAARWAVLYRGDPAAFLALPRCLDLLAAVMSGEIREPDAGRMAKEHPEGLAALDELWAGLGAWVAPTWLPSDAPRRVMGMTRRSVILADTDSSFVSLGPWVEFMHAAFDFSEATDAQRLTCTNAMIYLLCVLSREQMAALTRNLGVQEDRRKRLVFKNEFILKRVIMTSGKKHYVGWDRLTVNPPNCWNTLRARRPQRSPRGQARRSEKRRDWAISSEAARAA